jgi:hypothetical protein
MISDSDLEACKAACSDDEGCKAIGITTVGQCELYDTTISDLGFQATDNWFSVYDACCFEGDDQ